MFLKKTIIICNSLLLIFLVACKHITRVEADNPVLQSRQRLAAGDFQGALDVYRIAYARHPEDKALLNNYIKTIEDIKNSADKTFNENNFVAAGMIYHVLSRNYSSLKGFAQLLSFDRELLSARISDCSMSVYKKGLEQYRNGNLENAISIWKGVLTFDPDNADVRKAVDTASSQLKTLQQKK